jgi:hypothetical protein
MSSRDIAEKTPDADAASTTVGHRTAWISWGNGADLDGQAALRRCADLLEEGPVIGSVSWQALDTP